MHKKVKFKGEIYWYNTDTSFAVANISPLDHYTDDGKLLANPFYDISYAVVQGDDIMRFGSVIGKVSDLEDVK